MYMNVLTNMEFSRIVIFYCTNLSSEEDLGTVEKKNQHLNLDIYLGLNKASKEHMQLTQLLSRSKSIDPNP